MRYDTRGTADAYRASHEFCKSPAQGDVVVSVCLLLVSACSCGFQADCHCPNGSDGSICPISTDARSSATEGKDGGDGSAAQPWPDDGWPGDGMPETSLDAGPDAALSTGTDGQPEGWVDDCNGTVGRYGSGVIVPTATAAFERSYLQYFPQLGCPHSNNNGGIYVHSPCAGLDVQDFMQTDGSRAISSDGRSMLVLNPGLGHAFLLYDRIWEAYACMQTDECGTGMGGLSLLGPPTSDRYAEGGTIRQDFERGWMSLGTGNSGVTVHMNEPRTLDPALLSGCWADGGAPWITIINGESVDAVTGDVPGTDAAVKPPGDGSPTKAACRPRPVRAVTTSHFEEAHTPAPMCEIDESGVVSMRYQTFPGCPTFEDNGQQSGDYRACYFAQNEDVSAFERGSGLFEVKFCFDGPLYENLNLWFDTQDEPSTPLRLMRLLRGDDPTPRSCRTMLLSLQESCISAFQPTCGVACTDDVSPDAASPDLASPDSKRDSGGGSVDGGPTSPSVVTACAAFRRVKVRITTEYCQCPSEGCQRPAAADVQLLSLLYYPEDCLCATDADCDAGTFCRKDALPPDATCWKNRAGCRGICTP